MTLRLLLKSRSSVPVEVEGVTPEAVRDKPLADIERIPIFHGNTKVPLAEFFDVSGDPTDGRMEWEGDLSGVHWIGAGMSSGWIHIAGSAGRHLGSEMSGGEIFVDGDAGDWVGGEMHGGLIHVRGRAGHLIGAAYRGSARGMTGGTILIHGAVGNEIGHSMRRGSAGRRLGGRSGGLQHAGRHDPGVRCGGHPARSWHAARNDRISWEASRRRSCPAFGLRAAIARRS